MKAVGGRTLILEALGKWITLGHSDLDLWPSDPKIGVACRTDQGVASVSVG